MAKRFIDTNMFNDEWIGELSKDAKLFFVYFITTCDHAGVFKFNRRLCEFQTGLKNIDTLIKELGNSLVTLKENIYWMPRFIKFQYPLFPQSKVKQQDSALKILLSYGFDVEKVNSYLTLNEVLIKTYVSDNDNVIVTDNNINKIEFDVFWNLYDKKIGAKDKCISKWNKLTDVEREKIIYTLPQFLKTVSEKKFQPHPETYLNQKRWNDEIDLALITENGKKMVTFYNPIGKYTALKTEQEIEAMKKNDYFTIESIS